jgi:hypothetical protein
MHMRLNSTLSFEAIADLTMVLTVPRAGSDSSLFVGRRYLGTCTITPVYNDTNARAALGWKWTWDTKLYFDELFIVLKFHHLTPDAFKH